KCAPVAGDCASRVRHFQSFSTPQQNGAPKSESKRAHLPVTPAVARLKMIDLLKEVSLWI
ncbi:MAG TPA: hypothetical protein VKE92_01400, partial [Anaerolineales bacterium]|nr:hypothetical protein [Anaerolineales bacterium]